MNIWVYSFCWNEEKILPYFLRHYSSICSKIIVYDNGSTDQSEKLIRSCPIAEVRSYESGNEFRDDIKTQLSNNCWKEARGQADFVIVCDMDEFVYHPNLFQFLAEQRDQGYTMFKLMGYNMICHRFPEGDDQLYNLVTLGLPSDNSSKKILFDPNAFTETGFSIGSHKAKPVGNFQLTKDSRLKLLHFQFLGCEYLLKRYAAYQKRLSELNRLKHWGDKYLSSDLDLIEGFYRTLLVAKPVILD